MKKAVTSLAVLGIAAGIATGLVVWKRTNAGSMKDVAEFLPEETVLLAELPDLAATTIRWKETALWKIWKEPEVQAFLERPRSKIPQNAQVSETLALFDQAKARKGFFAVTGLEENMPRMVGGFAFSGSREAVEALVAKARAQAQAASPAGKTALEKHGEFEIESFSDKGVTVAGAFASGWYLAANDVALLKATLDRLAAPAVEGSLAGSEAFRKSASKLPLNPDFALYAQPALLFDRLIALSAMGGQPMDPKQVEELRKIEAIAGATRLEGERIRDAFFILRPGAEPGAKLSNSTLKLTSPETLLYAASAGSIPDKIELPEAGSPAGDQLGMAFPLWSRIQARLAEKGVPLHDLKKAFGPEMGLLSNWIPGSSQPQFAAAVQVQDAALARTFVEAAFDESQRQESGETTYWSVQTSSGGIPINLVAGLTGSHLVLGLTLDAVQAAIARAAGGGETLSASKSFEAALSTVTKPENAVVYLDTKALFERTYGVWRGPAMFLGAFVAEYVDVTKLPQTETISRHLQPSVLSCSQTADGVFYESTGTVTLYQGGIGLGLIGGAIAVPVLQGKIPLPGIAIPQLPGKRPARRAPQAVPFPTAPQSGGNPSAFPSPTPSEANAAPAGGKEASEL